MGTNTFSDTFSHTLLQVLRAHPAGISEYDLIKQLQADGQTGFDKDCLHGNLSLFQTHFLLFHSLYLLREQLSGDQLSGEQFSNEQLAISPLCIQLVPRSSAQISASAIDTHDPLRDYYLDLSQLENTQDADVDALLDQFWRRFVRNDERHAALHVLDLQDPVDWPTIKTQHRRLTMQHHPDRGGDAARLQAINAAMDTLARSGK